MSLRGPRARAAAVAVVLALAVVAGAGVVSVRAEDDPALPPVSAEQLLASAIDASSRPLSISGDVTTTLDLGVPELPASLGGGAGAPSVLASLLGEQRWKLWSSPEGVRLAHLLPAREQDLVVNAREAWWWDSAAMRAVHIEAPASAGQGWSSGSVPPAPGTALDPVELARTLIRGIAPCASVSVQGTDRVAGRDAYALALIPASSGSLVGSVRISIDAETRVPLRVEVRATGSDDAPISMGFTDVSFGPVDPAMFDFDPPPGTDVREASDPATPTEAGGDADLPAITDLRSFGTCAGVVVAARLDGPVPTRAAEFLPFAGPLGSAIAVDRGDHTWVLAGLVDADALEARAAALP
jgi:hypothetical protein